MAKPEIRPRKDGGETWTQRVDVGRDPVTGKRRRTRVAASSQRELKRAVARAVTRVDDGTWVAPSDRTVRDHLRAWLDGKKGDLRPGTYVNYERAIRLYLLPRLGNTKLQKLRTAEVTACYADLLARGGSRAPKPTEEDPDGSRPVGLSPRIVAQTHGILGAALEQAVVEGTIAANPARHAAVPKVRRREMTVWDRDRSRAFLAAAGDDLLSPLWLVALSTGMRRAELFGLRWEDVDLERGRLHVRQSIVTVRGRRIVQPPKTDAGRRAIPLSPQTVAALKAHRPRWAERRIAAKAWTAGDLVFAGARGGVLQPKELDRRFRAIAGAAGVPPIRFHDLRHTHATQLLADGVPAKVVSERLGHESVRITLDTYSHVLPGMQDAAVGTIDRALFGEGVA